ncbi:MAG: hypothetical protein KME54_18355 [Tolypothrix brevis GSE-NOS-MK-07-07A]|nr:hypothetical protein [Tolypothrix brevis GSE-NOS-MK-07-07A]
MKLLYNDFLLFYTIVETFRRNVFTNVNSGGTSLRMLTLAERLYEC